MPVAKLEFHHVGVGSTQFDAAIDTYMQLGHRLHSRVDDPLLDIRVAFLQAPGGASAPWIEILSPLGPDGPLKPLLARRALPAPYHTCYVAEDLGAAAEAMRNIGFLPLGEARPAVAFGGQHVAFFFSRSVGMLELVQGPARLPSIGV
jgi:methylmalonyl-CoA/ethylmalonyl-CoA epimerase